MSRVVLWVRRATAVVALSSSVIGCQSNAGTGALVGGATGAAVGAGIGSVSHERAGEGALVGGAVGVVGGTLIGVAMDDQDKQHEAQWRYSYNEEHAYHYDAGHADPYDNKPITKQDVINWSSRGTKDDVIIDRIDRSGSTS